MSEFDASKQVIEEELRKSLSERLSDYYQSDFAIIQKLLLLKYLLDINDAIESRDYEEVPESPQVRLS